MTALSTTIDLLRHGACADGEIFRGVTDSPLSATGWRQMDDALAPHRGWQRVISSPLQRCRRFAEGFATRHGLSLTLMPDLREIHFGRWEGRSIATVWREEACFLERYYRGEEDLAAPGGESPSSASARLHRAWGTLLHRHCGQHLLLVCHGGTIRLLLCRLLGVPLSANHCFAVPYGCLTRLRVHHLDGEDAVQLIFHHPPAPQEDTGHA